MSTLELALKLGKPYHGWVNLSSCPLRTKSRVTDVDVGAKFALRLQELGIRQGAEVVAVNRAAFGGLVLNVAGTRIAVDHRSAKKIQVEPVVPGVTA